MSFRASQSRELGEHFDALMHCTEEESMRAFLGFSFFFSLGSNDPHVMNLRIILIFFLSSPSHIEPMQ